MLRWLVASFRVRGGKCLSMGVIFRISKIRWFFVAGKDSSRRFGSAHQNTQLLDGFFRKDRIVGVSWCWSVVFNGQKRDWGRPLYFCGIFALCPSELTAVEEFLHLFIGNWFLTVFYGALDLGRQCCLFFWGLLQMPQKKRARNSGKWFVERQRAKETINGRRLRWISWLNFSKRKVCHLYSSQTCKHSSEKNIQFFFRYFFYQFRIFGASRTS